MGNNPGKPRILTRSFWLSALLRFESTSTQEKNASHNSLSTMVRNGAIIYSDEEPWIIVRYLQCGASTIYK